jgi:hypothetical protein
MQSLTTSRTPGASSATTGSPAAMASVSTMPWVSLVEAKANTSMACRASANCCCCRMPA